MESPTAPRHLCLIVVVTGVIGNFVFPAAAFSGGAVTSRAAVMLLLCWMGVIAAQVALHGIWTVFAPLDGGRRIVLAMFVGFVWIAAYILAAAATDDSVFSRDLPIVGAILLCTPLFGLMVQAPLWVLRSWRSWRIVRVGDAITDPSPFTTRELMIATVVVALDLGAVRAAAALLEKGGQVALPSEFVIGIAISALIGAGISTVTTVPILLATLRPANPVPRLSTILVIDFIVVVGVCVVVGLLARPAPQTDLVTGLVLLAAGFRVALTAVMIAARRVGLRLLVAGEDGSLLDEAP